MAASVALSMESPTNGAMTSAATSAKGLPAKDAMASGARAGHACGT